MFAPTCFTGVLKYSKREKDGGRGRVRKQKQERKKENIWRFEVSFTEIFGC